MAVYNFEYLIAGAGIIGSAAAYHLSEKSDSVAVIDIDLDGEYSSTLKNAGGVRATWRNPSNIQLCKYSIDFYRTIAGSIDFRQNGYYWLHNKKTWDEVNANLDKYLEFDLSIEIVEKKGVKNRLSFIDNTDGIEGLSVSRNAGIIDHYSLREYYRKNAKERGVKFFDRQFVYDMDVRGNLVHKVYTNDYSDEVRTKGKRYVGEILAGEDGEPCVKNEFRTECLVNCTGAWSSKLSKLYGYLEDENRPRRRQLELIHCPGIDLSPYGMVIDTSDVYFHKEGENILVGYSNRDEPYGVNFKFDFFSYDENSAFVEHIWKPLVKRNADFENLKFIRGWAGVYGETSDRSGYTGKVPGLQNVYECVGHTGRGLMISHGASRALADLITNGCIRDELCHATALGRERPSGPQYEELHL